MISAAADGVHGVYASDLDGDGDLDVLSASLSDNKIAWYENLLDVTPPVVVVKNPEDRRPGFDETFLQDSDPAKYVIRLEQLNSGLWLELQDYLDDGQGNTISGMGFDDAGLAAGTLTVEQNGELLVLDDDYRVDPWYYYPSTTNPYANTYIHSLNGLLAGHYTITLSGYADRAGNVIEPTTIELYVGGPGEIHGVKWEDVNGDGQRDPDELGVAGVTIYLDTNGNDQLDWNDADSDGQWQEGEGERWVLTQADDPGTMDVDEAGTYAFTDVAAGDYRVAEVVPAGLESGIMHWPMFKSSPRQADRAGLATNV